jgi:hypothetical protein
MGSLASLYLFQIIPCAITIVLYKLSVDSDNGTDEEKLDGKEWFQRIYLSYYLPCLFLFQVFSFIVSLTLQSSTTLTVEVFQLISKKIFRITALVAILLFLPMIIILVVIIDENRQQDGLVKFEIFLNSFQHALFTVFILASPYFYFRKREILAQTVNENNRLLNGEAV